MARYQTKTINSRGNLVTASQHQEAWARLQTLSPGVTKYNPDCSENAQTVGVSVTLYRDGDGNLRLVVDFAENHEAVLVEIVNGAHDLVKHDLVKPLVVKNG